MLAATGAEGSRELEQATAGLRVASRFSPERDPALRPAGPGEVPADVVRRHLDLLEEVADTHRGETVLVLIEEPALGLVVPALVPGAAAGGVVVLENDADGWVLRDQHLQR